MKGVNMTYDVMTLNNIGARLPCTCDVHEYEDWARLPITSIEVYAMDTIAFQAYMGPADRQFRLTVRGIYIYTYMNMCIRRYHVY